MVNGDPFRPSAWDAIWSRRVLLAILGGSALFVGGVEWFVRLPPSPHKAAKITGKIINLRYVIGKYSATSYAEIQLGNGRTITLQVTGEDYASCHIGDTANLLQIGSVIEAVPGKLCQ